MGLIDRAFELFRAGGWAMWPLLGLSLVSVTLSVERAAFWVSAHGGGRARRLARMTGAIRAGELSRAAEHAAEDGSLYGRFVASVVARLPSARGAEPSLAREEAEAARPAAERFASIHSTIITAAPMIGILGTVTGIIASFRLIGGAGPITDPTRVAAGIAEALLTTAAGLTVALITLFPYAIFRAQTDLCLSRLEMLAEAFASPAGRAGEKGGEGSGDA